MRQLILLLVGCFLVIGSLVAVFGTRALKQFELRGYVDPTKDRNLPFTVPRAGLNVELLQYSPAQLATQLEEMRAANFRWIRQFARWDALEPARGEFDWAAWDQLAARLAEQPLLEPVVVLVGSPLWALEDWAGDEMDFAPPGSLADFAAFAAAFAGRYGDLIDHYQIWDEPNLGDAWGNLDPKPAEYVALLATARAAILSADPQATIIAAALAPTTETAGRNISDIRYLDAMYRHGAAELMDVAAGKPYGFSSSPLDRRVDESLLNFSRIVALREVMLDHGDGATPLWASHFGWNSLPADWAGAPSIWGNVEQSERVQFSLQALDRAHREWPWLGAMFLHHWQPAADLDDPQWGFALVNPDGSPGPLLKALREYPYPQRAQNGLFHARSPHARYSGVWQFSELGADIGWLMPSDSQLTFDFYGSDIAMLLREDDYFAFLYPTVDGQPAGATQRDADGNAYILLRSDSRQPETNLVMVSEGLPLAEHRLRAVADQGWDRWAIAGYAVSSGDLAAPYDQQLALGWLALALSLAAFSVALRSAPWASWLPRLANLAARLSSTAHLALAGLTSVFMMLAMLWTWDSPRASILLREDVNIALALATGGLLYLSGSFLLSVTLGLVLFVLICQRLETGLILTLLWAPFFLFPLSLYRFAIPMAEALILITAAAGGLRLLAWLGASLQIRNTGYPLLPRSILRKLRPMDLAVAALAALGILSLLWARRPDTALTELRTLIIEPLLFYALFRSLRPGSRTMLKFAGAIVVAALLVCAVGLYGYFSGDFVIRAENDAWRLQSVYGSPNNVALLLGRAIPFALAIALVELERRWRILALLSIVVMLPSLLLTQSVGAFALGLPAGLIALLVGRYQRRAIAPVVALLAAGTAAFGMLSRLSPRFANLLDFSRGTDFVRLRLWESAVSMLRDHPLTGLGLDQFLYRFRGEYLRPDAIWNPELSHPHNFLLDFWLRLSVAGLACFALIQALFWRSTHRALRRFRGRDPLSFALALGLAGSMAALLAHGMIDNSVFVIDLALIFAFQLAAMARLDELSRRPEA